MHAPIRCWINEAIIGVPTTINKTCTGLLANNIPVYLKCYIRFHVLLSDVNITSMLTCAPVALHIYFSKDTIGPTV